MRHFSTMVRAGLLDLALGLLLLTGVCVADAPKPPQEQKPADCELILKGGRIEKLVLIDKDEKLIELVRPGDRVLLPAGQYAIRQIDVEGGWSSQWSNGPLLGQHWSTPDDRLLVLSPGRPCRPNMGMPLVPEISARRVGRLINVKCYGWQMCDGDGRSYRKVDRNARPPRFAVYQGDRDVTASGVGSLEFG
jgi:hypothetical protein